MSNLKEYVVVLCKDYALGISIPEIWTKEQYQMHVSSAMKGTEYPILATFNASDELKDSPYQGSAGVWVKASERLPEFVSRDKSYVVRYVMGNHPFEIWNWDMLNDREANGYVVEWLDESAASPAGDGWNLNMNEAPKDGTRIQAWHKLWECPISVKWVGDKIQHEKFPWVCVTLANTWPEEAFTAWQPLPTPPNKSV